MPGACSMKDNALHFGWPCVQPQSQLPGKVMGFVSHNLSQAIIRKAGIALKREEPLKDTGQGMI